MAAKLYSRYAEGDDFEGPFPLNRKTVSQIDNDAYGVYLLVCPSDKGFEIVIYVGRGILRDRLTAHITGTDGTHFYCKLLDDDDEGFAEECRLFHEYGKRPHLDNRIHPAVPAGAPRNYPRCSERGCKGEAD